MPDKTQVGNDDPYRHTIVQDYRESSEVTPDFAGKKARKEELPQHEYLFENYKFTGNLVPMCSDFNRVNANFGFLSLKSTLLHGIYLDTNCGISAGTYQRQHQKLMNNLFDEVVGDATLDSVPFVKELPEFVGTCVDAALSIADIFKGLRRGQPDKVADVLLSGKPTRRYLATERFRDAGLSRRSADALSNRWLEAQYGILPALSDVNNAGKIMDQLLVPPERAKKAEAYFPFFEGITVRRQNPVDPNWSNTTAIGTIRSRHKATAIYTVDSPWDVLYQQLALDVPAYGVWECIPFSFVIDWFIPVGDWLRSGRSIMGKTLTRGWYSEKHEGSIVHTHKYCASPTAVGVSRYLTKYRQGLSGFPLFQPTDVWDPSASVKRFFNGLSLAWQQASSRR